VCSSRLYRFDASRCNPIPNGILVDPQELGGLLNRRAFWVIRSRHSCRIALPLAELAMFVLYLSSNASRQVPILIETVAGVPDALLKLWRERFPIGWHGWSQPTPASLLELRDGVERGKMTDAR
jgi:hypothetical protein